MHPQVPGTLSSASTEHDWLRLLIGLEYVAEGSYYISTAKLTDAGHLRLAGEIMGSDAQHAAWLGQRLHRGDVSRSVPAAFVQGIP
jgi:hypothetical protein